MFLFVFRIEEDAENYVTLTLRPVRTASHSVSIGIGLGRAAQERHAKPDQQQEHGGPEGDDPEDHVAVDEPGEEIPEEGKGRVVDLGSAAVRAQHTAADQPRQHGNYQESEQEREPEVDQLTARTRLGVERAARACQRFDQKSVSLCGERPAGGIIASP